MEEVLKHFGLSEKESLVYLALLELGQSTAPAISKKAGVKHPTTYVILDELRKKGLLTEIPKKFRSLYTPKSPDTLLAARREANEEIRLGMPEILALYNIHEEKPKVRFYQGEKEMLGLYHKEIFQEEKEILFVASLGSIPPSILSSIEEALPRLRKKGVMLREIEEDDPVSQGFKKRHKSQFYLIKTAPKNFSLPTDNAIYGNKIAIFSYKTDPLAVVIESEDVVKTYRSLFEMAWSAIE